MIDWDQMVIGPCIDTLGEPVTYMPAAGGSFGINGVFTDAYHKDSIFEDRPGVVTVSPTLGVNLSEFPTPPKQDDQVFVPRVNTTYLVKPPIRLDGLGGAVLTLNKMG